MLSAAQEIVINDGLNWAEIVAISAGGAAVIGFVVLVLRYTVVPLVRESHEFFMWWKKFQRDWDGEPAEPGRDAVPGVMQRLNRIDGELHHNGGNSLKDKVAATAASVDALAERVNDIEERQMTIYTILDRRQPIRSTDERESDRESQEARQTA